MTTNQEPTEKKNQGLTKAGILIGGGIIFAVAGAAYAVYSVINTGAQNLSPFKSAQLVPDEALLTSYIYTDSQAWSNLEQFGTPKLKALVEENRPSLQQLLDTNNLNFQQDIQSWAGGIMLAYMPSSDSSQNNAQTSLSNPATQSTSNSDQKSGKVAPLSGNFLAVIGIENKAKALTFLNEEIKGGDQTQLQKTDYQGITVWEVTPSDDRSKYVARLDNHLLFSPQHQTVKQAIDVSKGEASFADNPGAAKSFQQGTQIQHPIAEVYITDYAKLFRELLATSPETPQFSEDSLSQLQQIKQIVGGIGVDNEGIRMQLISEVDPSELPEGYNQTAPGDVIKQFPQDTVALITGIGINRGWSQLKTQAEEIPELKQLVALIRSTLQSFNLDADQDVFSWMDGEFGIGSVALSSQSGMLGQFGMGFGIVMETSDRAAAESTLKKVQDIAKKQASFLTFGKKSVGNVEITQWKLSEQQSILGHGWLDDNSVLIAFGDGLAAKFAGDKGQNLSTASQFQEMTKTLPQSNMGYFYLDMDQAVSILNQIPPVANNGMPSEMNAILNSVNGIGVTANWQNQSTSRLEMLVSLKETSEATTNSPSQ